jgi:hypothetical protein
VPANWEEFGRRLQEAVDSYLVEGEYAVAVTDLQTGLTVHVNGDRHQMTGCIINWFVILSAMLDVEAGLYGIDAAGALIDETIRNSNAGTAFELYRLTGQGSVAAGVEKVQALLESLDMDESRIHHPPAFGGAEGLSYEVEAGGVTASAAPNDDNNWSTALDVNRALTAFYNGDVLGEPWRADLLRRMTLVKPGLNYLTAYVPYGEVSHKNGFFPDDDGTYVDNDIGIVQVERDGHSYAYVISFFSQGVPQKYADIPLGQELSTIAFEYFRETYGR